MTRGLLRCFTSPDLLKIHFYRQLEFNVSLSSTMFPAQPTQTSQAVPSSPIPLTPPFWGGGNRTLSCAVQSRVPSHLATPHYRVHPTRGGNRTHNLRCLKPTHLPNCATRASPQAQRNSNPQPPVLETGTLPLSYVPTTHYIPVPHKKHQPAE